MKNCGAGKLAVLVVLVLVLMPVELIASRREAKINHATVTTRDGLLFSAWVSSESVSYGRNIVIQFQVTNRSSKAIYLVRENTPEIFIDRNSLVIPGPFVLVGGHERYEYTFTKVARGKSYHGQLIISKDEYQSSRPWLIEVGFGYVNNIIGLNKQLAAYEDPAPLKMLLRSRLETLQLCGIGVEIVDKPK